MTKPFFFCRAPRRIYIYLGSAQPSGRISVYVNNQCLHISARRDLLSYFSLSYFFGCAGEFSVVQPSTSLAGTSFWCHVSFRKRLIHHLWLLVGYAVMTLIEHRFIEDPRHARPGAGRCERYTEDFTF